LLVVLRHEKTPKVGVQLLGFSSNGQRFFLPIGIAASPQALLEFENNANGIVGGL
jgi:hypothetical protein